MERFAVTPCNDLVMSWGGSEKNRWFQFLKPYDHRHVAFCSCWIKNQRNCKNSLCKFILFHLSRIHHFHFLKGKTSGLFTNGTLTLGTVQDRKIQIVSIYEISLRKNKINKAFFFITQQK